MAEDVNELIAWVNGCWPVDGDFPTRTRRNRFTRMAAEWVAMARNFMNENNDAHWSAFYADDDVRLTRHNFLDTVYMSAQRLTRKITIPDVRGWVAQYQTVGSLASQLSIADNLDQEQRNWGVYPDTRKTPGSNARIPVPPAVNDGPEQKVNELVVWYKRAYLLHLVGTSAQGSFPYVVLDGNGWVTDVDWRALLREQMPNIKVRMRMTPERIIRYAHSLENGLRSYIEEERDRVKRNGYDPDDPNSVVMYKQQSNRYMIDFDWVLSNGYVPAGDLLRVTPGKSNTEVPLSTLVKASAERMKEVLAESKKDNNFIPAPPPQLLLDVQIPIYDRGQKGYRILNRAWTPQQRLAFVKHTLDTMSGIPIKAQELDIVSASGQPVPLGATVLDFGVKWTCTLTGLFHDPADAYFYADMQACQDRWRRDYGESIDGSDPHDRWHQAHRPWVSMQMDYSNNGSSYWMYIGHEHCVPQKSR